MDSAIIAYTYEDLAPPRLVYIVVYDLYVMYILVITHYNFVLTLLYTNKQKEF